MKYVLIAFFSYECKSILLLYYGFTFLHKTLLNKYKILIFPIKSFDTFFFFFSYIILIKSTFNDNENHF